MSYCDFTLDSVCQTFALALNDQDDLFAGIPAAPVNSHLQTTLEEFAPLAISIHTEKARSEFIVAPILGEVRRLMKPRISLFSGVDFSVDPVKGLSGTCDFIFSASPVQHLLRVPVMMIVEAKNDNIEGGMGQCIAEMVAARLFNDRQNQGHPTIHGAVTTGSLWSFLRLDSGSVFLDRNEYNLAQVGNILAILLHCVGGDPSSAGAAA
jgi:hypothetical protein